MQKFQKVLFVCTGNIYRSRFAEALFNSLSAAESSDWRAESRGFRPRPLPDSLSPEALMALNDRAIPSHYTRATAAPLMEEDLEEASLVVLLKESEHRPMLSRVFPDWPERVYYWEIHDIDVETPDEALPKLEKKVRELFGQLSNGHAISGREAIALKF